MRLARAVSGENREKGTAAGGFPGSSYRAGPVVPKRISACPSRPGRPLRSTWTEPFFRKIRLTWSAAGDPPAARAELIWNTPSSLFSRRCPSLSTGLPETAGDPPSAKAERTRVAVRAKFSSVHQAGEGSLRHGGPPSWVRDPDPVFCAGQAREDPGARTPRA